MVLITVLAISRLYASPALESRAAKQLDAVLLPSSSNKYYANSLMTSEKLLLLARRRRMFIFVVLR